MKEAQSGWAIETRGLTKSFSNLLALNSVDLVVGRGQTLVVFGPNGAGKSTLIKILSTIMRPSSGEVLIDGFSLKGNAEEVRRRIGLVSHYTFLYSNLTAYENLQFYSRLYDVPNFRERIYEVADMVGMSSRLHDSIAIFSRGMQQRLSIARALLHRPVIMLLDEPETGLDQQAIAMLWESLRADGGDGRTILFTSHSLERGLEACDHLLILHRGRIVHQQPNKGLDLESLRRIYRQSTGVGSEAIA
jgi:heme exporter protein A